MIERTLIFKIIQESVDSLFDAELIHHKVIIDENTVLLGKGSPFDSISFITLFSEIEDRLSTALGKEVFIDFNKLHDSNADKHNLVVSVLISYLINTIGDED